MATHRQFRQLGLCYGCFAAAGKHLAAHHGDTTNARLQHDCNTVDGKVAGMIYRKLTFKKYMPHSPPNPPPTNLPSSSPPTLPLPHRYLETTSGRLATVGPDAGCAMLEGQWPMITRAAQERLAVSAGRSSPSGVAVRYTLAFTRPQSLSLSLPHFPHLPLALSTAAPTAALSTAALSPRPLQRTFHRHPLHAPPSGT